MPTVTTEPSSRTQQWVRVKCNSLDDISTSNKSRMPTLLQSAPRDRKPSFSTVSVKHELSGGIGK
jgi:hypothetical protein